MMNSRTSVAFIGPRKKQKRTSSWNFENSWCRKNLLRRKTAILWPQSGRRGPGEWVLGSNFILTFQSFTELPMVKPSCVRQKIWLFIEATCKCHCLGSKRMQRNTGKGRKQLHLLVKIHIYFNSKNSIVCNSTKLPIYWIAFINSNFWFSVYFIDTLHFNDFIISKCTVSLWVVDFKGKALTKCYLINIYVTVTYDIIFWLIPNKKLWVRFVQ